MKPVSKLFLIFFMSGLIAYCLPQKVFAISYEGVTSFEIYKSKANQGNADAQFNLAFLYQRGVGIPQDTRYAIYWYKKAAEQGHANAQYSLGSMYRYSYDTECPRDFEQSVYWYTKAAEQGHADAQYSLGYMNDYGDEIPQDYKQAFFWYTKAVEKGHYFAKTHRDQMLEKMSQSQIEEVRKLSEEFYEKINNKAK